MVHAVGLAWAERMRGSSRVAITYFGDGATSEGDFHEAMNFAGVQKLGVVFLCQNNGWAISLPTERTDRRGDHRRKGHRVRDARAQVDGNDLLACTRHPEAVDRAQGGYGPTLIEAVTYRVGLTRLPTILAGIAIRMSR